MLHAGARVPLARRVDQHQHGRRVRQAPRAVTHVPAHADRRRPRRHDHRHHAAVGRPAPRRRARRARRQPRSRHAAEARPQFGGAHEGDRRVPRDAARATRSSTRLSANGVPCAEGRRRSTSSPTWSKRSSPGYLVREVHPELGEMLHPRPAVTFDEDVVIRPAPAIGEHTAEILAELDGTLTASGAGRRDRRGLGVARRRRRRRRVVGARRREPALGREAVGALARVLGAQVFADGGDDARRLAPDRDTGEAGAEPRATTVTKVLPGNCAADQREELAG